MKRRNDCSSRHWDMFRSFTMLTPIACRMAAGELAGPRTLEHLVDTVLYRMWVYFVDSSSGVLFARFLFTDVLCVAVYVLCERLVCNTSGRRGARHASSAPCDQEPIWQCE